MTEALYIIGNGFDRYHNVPSDYKDFGDYLKNVDLDTFREVEEYFVIDDDFWWEFEARLASFDVDTVVDNASQFLMSYAAKDWSDSAHHDYQYELNRVVKAISSTMRMRFAEWIRQLPIPSSDSFMGKLLPLHLSAHYLNFNYTPTLQQTYGIADDQVLHIHGQAGNPSERLVLGHGWRRSAVDSQNYRVNPEDIDIRVLEGNRIVDDYFSATFKPTDKIIVQQQPFFRNLRSVRQIFVMGHSLSEVDAPYLEEIIKNIDKGLVMWKISYHEDAKPAQDRMLTLGIDPAHTTYARLSEF